MKKLSCFFSALLFTPLLLLGQQYQLTPTVIASSGEMLVSSNYILSFTLGEAVIETFEGNTVLTQGFQQTALIVVGTEETNFLEGEVNVFPNPTEGLISIDLKLPQYDPVEISLYDLSGKRVKFSSHQIQAGVIELSILDLPNGVYALEILNSNTQKRASYKVVKN